MTEMSDAINKASNLPPFPGPASTQDWTNATYSQLDGDLRFNWGARYPSDPDRPMSTLSPAVRARLHADYPRYVVDAAYKRIMLWAMERGIVSYSRALGAWSEYFGKHAWSDAEHRLSWFARVSRL